MILVAALLASCGSKDKKGMQGGDETPLVQVQSVYAEAVDETSEYAATVEAFKTNNIMSSTGNRIKSLLVDVGSHVKAGQTLVILAGDLNKSAVAQRRGGYDTDPSSFWKQPSFSTTYFESYGVYFRNVLGYPVNLGDRETAIRYSGMSEVVGMPAFPSPGCIRMIGDALVVKLSDDISLQSTSEKDRTFSDGY